MIGSHRFSAQARLAALLGSASVFAIANAGDARGEAAAQAEEVPETVLITDR
jgi:hypothetical protein